MASSQMRLSGLISGMDTDSIISQLVSAKSTNVNKLVASQTKLSWKQEIWKDLNKEVKSLVNGTLDNLRYSTAYTKKTTDASNSDKVTVTTGANAMNTVQSLKINKVATSAYMTGGQLASNMTSGSAITDALGVKAGSKISFNMNGNTTEIEISEGMTINGLLTKFQNAGVEANYDRTNNRIFIGAKNTGSAGDFTITANDADGLDALNKLGLAVYDDKDPDSDSSKLKASLQETAKLAVGGDATKRADAIATRKTELTDYYNSLKSDLADINTTLTEQLGLNKDSFLTDYGIDLSDATARADRKAELEAIAEEDLTDDQKNELEAINAYEEIEKNIADNTAKIAEYDTKLADIDTEATADIDARAAKAQSMLDNWTKNQSSGAHKIKGVDAEIELNGAVFTSASNTLVVNDLTLELKGETFGDETITLTTRQDTSGIYDTIKNFFKQYNELINKMDKLYNADSAEKYNVLTDDEKEAMSEKEIEKWEQTIKDSLLRRDSTINTATSAMKSIMSAGYMVNGKTMYLSSFGINTLNYFAAADNEKNAYHISGDEDDDNVKNESNELLNMIKTDPNAVIGFFTQLTNSLYTKMNSLMASNDFSSYGTLYDDKKMASEYSNYASKISKAEEKLADYEDRWYSKFAKMEKAMAKLQSNGNSLSSIMGTS